MTQLALKRARSTLTHPLPYPLWNLAIYYFSVLDEDNMTNLASEREIVPWWQRQKPLENLWKTLSSWKGQWAESTRKCGFWLVQKYSLKKKTTRRNIGKPIEEFEFTHTVTIVVKKTLLNSLFIDPALKIFGELWEAVCKALGGSRSCLCELSRTL